MDHNSLHLQPLTPRHQRSTTDRADLDVAAFSFV